MLYPLTFRPIFKERPWGGRKLEQVYHKPLPPRVPIGESWEISQRHGATSIVAQGPLAGKDLGWIMAHHSQELLGKEGNKNFPLLVKILDCRERLSLQVHPPKVKAAELGGEPKTEMWYVAHAEPGAELFAGLRRGVTRSDFLTKTRNGTVAECFHRLSVKTGDVMFLPSGRVHGLGAGLLIFEIQQNSDTTFRVYDWNRVGLDGKPRELHVDESMASIDFNDFEPDFVKAEPVEGRFGRVRRLVESPLFSVEHWALSPNTAFDLPGGTMQVIGVLAGGVRLIHRKTDITLAPGQFCLVPALVTDVRLSTADSAALLRTQA